MFRGWQDSPGWAVWSRTPPSGCRSRATPYEIRPDVAVPMPDGVALLANHYRPAGPERPLPVVLIRVPYGRSGPYGLLFAAPLVRRGLQVFLQATRGTFGSGGQFRWLNHHLNGGPAPAGAPVRVYLQHAGRWLEFGEWPPAGARQQVLHLRGDGRLGPAADDDAAEPSRFTYDPADPTPTVGGPLLQPPGKQADNTVVEERDDVLVFTGPVLPANLDVVGGVEATVYVRTELPYADVFVRLCDVDENDVSRNVVDGIRRLDPRTVDAPDIAAGGDGVLAVRVELFPTGYRFRAGHRVRVQVSGGAFPGMPAISAPRSRSASRPPARRAGSRSSTTARTRRTSRSPRWTERRRRCATTRQT